MRGTSNSILNWVEKNKMAAVVVAFTLISLFFGLWKSAIISSLVFLFMSEYRRQEMGYFAKSNPIFTGNIGIVVAVMLLPISMWWVVPITLLFTACYLITEKESWGKVGTKAGEVSSSAWKEIPTSAKFFLAGIGTFAVGFILFKSGATDLATLIGLIGIVLVGIPLVKAGKGTGDFFYSLFHGPVKSKDEKEKLDKAREVIEKAKEKSEAEYNNYLKMMVESGLMTEEEAKIKQKKFFSAETKKKENGKKSRQNQK